MTRPLHRLSVCLSVCLGVVVVVVVTIIRTKLTYRLNENLVKKREGLLEALTPDNGGWVPVLADNKENAS